MHPMSLLVVIRPEDSADYSTRGRKLQVKVDTQLFRESTMKSSPMTNWEMNG